MIDFPHRRGIAKLSAGRSSLAENETLMGDTHMLQTHAVRTGSTVAPAGSGEPAWIHLRAAGVSLLLHVPSAGPPVVRHWGADLGPLEGPDAAAALDMLLGDHSGASPYAVVPGCGEAGRPGLRGSHDGQSTRPTFTDVATRLVSRPEPASGLTELGADTVVVTAECATTGICLDVAIQLTASGVVRCRAGLTNRAAEPYRLEALPLVLPAGERATHTVDLGTSPPRVTPLPSGTLTVPDSADGPQQVVVAEAGAGYRRGEVWQSHVAFSGAVAYSVEVVGGRTYVGGGERLVPGEVVLGRGESYHSPWVLWCWGDGLDAAAARLHDEQRGTEAAPVPVVFDATAPAFAGHDRAAMLRLAEYASAVGVETFLVDLAWCERAGLDPYADHEVRGDATTVDNLAGLLDRIRDLDLEVGLALDLERLDPGSPIARDHPEWLLEVERDGTVELVLDLSMRSAVGYVWERLTKLLDRHPVSLVSWSPVVGARRPGSAERRHETTLAAYRLLDALRERYPQMIIVSAARDVTMARRAVVADGIADSTRRHTQFGSLVQLLPPERLWQPAYDEPEDATTPGYRAVAAFFGGLGLGLDLCQQPPASLRAIHRWLSAYKEYRPLLHAGRTVRIETGQSGLIAHGVVSPERDEALFALVWCDRAAARVRLDGLDPATTYRLEVAGPRPTETLGWATGDEAPRSTGRALATAGLALPEGRRGSALLVHLTAV
jgi:alpha-galactosidase